MFVSLVRSYVPVFAKFSVQHPLITPRNWVFIPTVGAARAWVARHRQARSCAVAVRDFYHFWKARSEHSRAGKPLIVDPTDSATVQMFFDDLSLIHI